MSKFSDQYFKLMEEDEEKKKKKKKTETKVETKSSGDSFSDEYNRLIGSAPTTQDYIHSFNGALDALKTETKRENAFGGNRTTKSVFSGEEEEERKWFQKGAFEDGYQFGDVTKTILGTVTDTAENLGAGIIGMGEKVVDTLATIAPYVAQGQFYQNGGAYQNLTTQKMFNESIEEGKEWSKEFVKKDLYDEEKVAKFIISNPVEHLTGIDAEEDSVFGEKTDALAQSGGQLLATAGLQAVGVPWFVTTGVTSFGGEAENAFNQGATNEEAVVSAAISAGAEILTEKLSGGISFGGKTLDDLAVNRLSRAISNKTLRAMAKFGMDAVGEGSEEVISQVFSNLGSSLYKEESLGELLASEEAIDEYIESFIGGAVLGGVSSGINTVKSNAQGVDAVTGLTENEQKVIDKVYKDAVAEAEQDGKKLTQKEKDKLYEAALDQMDKGYISTDTIEEVLGGETYRDYKTTVDYEDALLEEYETLGNKQNATLAEQTRYNELLEKKKNLEQTSQRNALKSRLSEEVSGLVQSDRLMESYNERGRRGQAFEADLTQYDSKAQETIKKAIDSGILNNTNRTHEFVDLIAKISADKGVPFDFTNNQRLKDSGFAVDGKQVNGFVHNGNITLNIDSAKALQSTVGHEVTHVLEGTELYDALSQTVIEYAKSKGDYQGRYDALSKLYEGVGGANIDAELTADLVGDYLFSDTDFVKNLSVQNRNVFQKIYDEIKYLVKVATAGSKEARELAKVQKAFEDAYRESGKVSNDTKYSLGYHAGDLGKAEFYHQQGYSRGTGHFGTGTYFVGDEAKINDSTYGKRPHETVEFDNYNLYKIRNDNDGYELHDQLRVLDGGISQDFLDAAKENKFNVSELRRTAWDRAEGYDTEVWDDDLEMFVSSDYIGASVRAFTEVANENGVEIQSYDEWLAELSPDDIIKPGEPEYGYYKGDYLDYLKETLDAVDGEKNEGYDKFRDAYFHLWLRFGQGKVNEALQKVIEHQQEMNPDGERNFFREQEKHADSNATVFMKALGYEGIDTRGSGLDNTAYGSVIYDLKGDDAKRKAEIGTAKYSLSDSDGKQLTKEQQEYFKDSKVRDHKGNLKVMYHGTNAEFTVFDRGKLSDGLGFFFTENKSEARDYGAPKPFYLNITNPFDIFGDTPIESFIGDAPKYVDGHFNYDAAVKGLIDAGYDGIQSFSHGTEWYVAFKPEQIKNIDNAKPTSDPDIRFSLSEPVEQTKDLMALHNLTEQKLLKSLKLGGLPMPSVAIAKAQDGHSEFGEISLVLPREAIDPKESRNNKLYSGDAWTPTYPSVAYKVDEKVLRNISKKLYNLVPSNVLHDLGRISLDADNMTDTLNRWGGDAVEAFRSNDALKYAYLVDNGADITLPMKEKRISYGSRENGEIIRVAEAIPADEIKQALNGSSDEMRKLEPRVRQAVAEYWQETYANEPELLELMVPKEELSFSELDGYLSDAMRYHRNGVEQSVDSRAAKTAIADQTIQHEYEKWLEQTFSGIVEKEGIRNNKDYFTPSGNRRSFEALHYEHNLENVIKAMREKGEKGIGGFGGGSIFGAATTEFSSVEEMKQSSDRLQMMSEEEYQAMRDEFSNRFFEIAGRLPNDKRSFMATDDAANTLVEAVSKYNTRNGIANYLKRELSGWATYSDQAVDDLIELVRDIRNMPTGYFEAKPQRAVGFDEVGVFVIPNNADMKLKQELLNRGYAIAEYDPNIEGHRQQVVNQFEEYKFSLSNVGETPVRRMSDIYGSDVKLETEQKVAPVAVAENATTAPVGETVSETDTLTVAENATVPEKKPNTVLYNVRDGKNGWGEVYSTAQEALNDAVQYVNPELWSDIEREVETASGQKRSNTPMIDALVAVQEDVRQQTITPIQGAKLLNEVYTRYGAKALGKLYYPGTGNLYSPYLERAKKYDTTPPVAEEMFPDDMAPVVDDSERIDSLTDEDAPPEMEAPYYESQPVTVDDPMAGRFPEDMGKRSIKAYMYENPEVKPFFQQEANAMLGELINTTKGERTYADVDYMNEYGYTSQGVWSGTKRHTSDDIAYLLDKYHYTYDQIEKGLKAIIEDNGAENNAVSKRIEFILNDRLIDGYTDFYYGEEVPPNQDYINLINEKQITEYSKEAFDALMANADEYAPISEEIAPMVEEEMVETNIGKMPLAEYRDMVAQQSGFDDYAAMRSQGVKFGNEYDTGDFAPVKVTPAKEAYEAIRPKPVKEPKLAKATPQEQARANILVEEPKVDKKKPGAWNLFKDNFVDKGTIFETLSLKTGNRELQGRWKSIGRAESRAQWFMEHGNAGTSSLKSIRETVENSGKTQQFYEYLYHQHNVDRMNLADRYEGMENKPVFGYSVTSKMSKEEAAKLEKANPEFKKWANEVYTYMTTLREMMVDNGVISRDTANLWAEMYPHYVPVRRKGDEGLNINVALDTKRTGVNAPVKRATGGNRDILPLFDTMAMRTEQTFKANARNRFGVELKNLIAPYVETEAMDIDEAIDSVENEELLQEGKDGKNPTFTVFDNGEKVTFEITEEMYDTMKPKSKAMGYTNKVLNTANNIRRGLLTEYNPAFMLTNPIKDTQDVMINSQHPARTYANYPKAIAELLGKGHYYQEYMENGGEMNTYFDGETKTFAKEKSGLSKLIGFPLEKISQGNNFIERVPRMAEYIASRQEGRSIDVSMLDAARVTTDFSAGGDLVKFANRNGFTFLNASVQGAVQQVRNVREAKAEGLKGWAKLAAKVAVAGLPSVLLNHLLWDDDEEYAELSDYVKQNYYIVGKYGDGKFVRIPKGRALAVIQNAFEQMENLVTGNDEVDLKAFGELVLSNLAPSNPLENNLIAPVTQALSNKTWYGEDLVPTRLQDLPTEEQFDETTDSLSKWLGEHTPISPYKWNYILDQYSGAIGDVFLPMITPEAERGNDTIWGDLIAPITDKFTTDGVMKNQNISDFYDKKDELTTNAKGSGATEEDVLMNKYMNSINDELSDLYAEKRKIQNSDLSNAEKYEAVRNIQKQIVDLTREGLATYDDIDYQTARDGEYVNIGNRYFKQDEEGEWNKLSDDQVTKYKVTSEAGDSNYATDGEVHYRWYESEDGEEGWRKISDKELERQTEITDGLGITPEAYWNNKEEYTYAFDYPENYAVSKAVGGYESFRTYTSELYDISADKDENGKSISGSRKEKVVDYINNLDADYYTKLILFKYEYNSDDSHNMEIINYLNGRSDISFEEEIIILRKLGFEVDSRGNISW